MSERASVADKLWARAIDRFSAITSRENPGRIVSALTDLVVGDVDWRVHWRVTETDPGEINWFKAAGEPDSGRLPSRYRSALVLGTSAQRLARQAEEQGGSPAVAFAVGGNLEDEYRHVDPRVHQVFSNGGVVLAGVVELPKAAAEVDPDVQFGMRIGQSGLRTAIGVLTEGDHSLSFTPVRGVSRLDREVSPDSGVEGWPIDEVRAQFPTATLV